MGASALGIWHGEFSVQALGRLTLSRSPSSVSMKWLTIDFRRGRKKEWRRFLADGPWLACEPDDVAVELSSSSWAARAQPDVKGISAGRSISRKLFWSGASSEEPDLGRAVMRLNDDESKHTRGQLRISQSSSRVQWIYAGSFVLRRRPNIKDDELELLRARVGFSTDSDWSVSRI